MTVATDDGIRDDDAAAGDGQDDRRAVLLDSAKEPEFLDWLKRVRRKIHEYPELAFQEHETGRLIISELKSIGIDYSWPVAKTRIVASVGSAVEPWFGLRADMDALPIQEMVEWEHKSKNKRKMHACGHDVHRVQLIMSNPYSALHVAPELPTGTIGSRPGPMLAGSARFQVKIQGKSGDAAQPHTTTDPVLAASFSILALQQLVSRETNPLESRVIETQATVHRCTATVDFLEEKMRAYPATVNDESMYEHVKKSANLCLENLRY
ncbi:IAA-amino acid hydrolase ILR1-like 4 [Hibiscus syriacus]|uniref:IAA-amino acid hydrolase ILR1-like 4 n=1 Tax=Hibiscus syriacus TaxID=106335 RepID=UPI001923E6A7|nr:IAA-amino acid hydrolase ILR1-like 4 [Hibiscus syriacus]